MIGEDFESHKTDNRKNNLCQAFSHQRVAERMSELANYRVLSALLFFRVLEGYDKLLFLARTKPLDLIEMNLYKFKVQSP